MNSLEETQNLVDRLAFEIGQIGKRNLNLLANDGEFFVRLDALACNNLGEFNKLFLSLMGMLEEILTEIPLEINGESDEGKSAPSVLKRTIGLIGELQRRIRGENMSSECGKAFFELLKHAEKVWQQIPRLEFEYIGNLLGSIQRKLYLIDAVQNVYITMAADPEIQKRTEETEMEIAEDALMIREFIRRSQSPSITLKQLNITFETLADLEGDKARRGYQIVQRFMSGEVIEIEEVDTVLSLINEHGWTAEEFGLKEVEGFEALLLTHMANKPAIDEEKSFTDSDKPETARMN